MAHQLRFGLTLLPMLLLGCPDSEARFNEFEDRTMDYGEESGSGTGDSDSGTETGEEGLQDMSGTYLLALETALGPGSPLQFVTTVDMVVAPDGLSATATMVFQPLSLNTGSLLEPREFVGEVLEFTDIAFDMEGNYVLDMGLVEVTGAANPVSGSDIAATIVNLGHIVHQDALCGDITGMLMSPLEADLAGSTFAMWRLDDDGSNPATLPTMFPYKCEQVGPPTGDGDGDTGTDTTDSGTDTGTSDTTTG